MSKQIDYPIRPAAQQQSTRCLWPQPQMDDREPDIHNFSTPSSEHRLPTVTAVEALQNAAAKARGIPSGLPTLDNVLVNSQNGLSIATPGIQRGHVTEVFGPPGVGKTTFGLQATVNAMHSTDENCHVLWINTGSPLVEQRLEDLMNAYNVPPSSDLPSSPPEPVDVDSLLEERLIYLDAHTLPILLTVFLHPQASIPSPQTCMIVVDNLSNLLLGAFSRTSKNPQPSAPLVVRERLEKQAASKRFQVLESLATAMSKMAALRNIAVLVLTNATTSLKGSNRATLKPALSSQAWESAIHTRVMLYRDFADEAQLAEVQNGAKLRLRYADVQRMERKEVFTSRIPFVISMGGLRELSVHVASQAQHLAEFNGIAEATGADDDLPFLPVELSQPSQLQSPMQHRKRKAVEIADSEDEDEGDVTDPDEPQLPRMNILPRGMEDDMILEVHETALLRRERLSRIRGSEDELPEPPSDSEEDGGGVDDEDQDEIASHQPLGH